MLGAYGPDVLNEHGKRLLTFASDSKHALTNTISAHVRLEYYTRSTVSAAVMTEDDWTTS